MQTAQPLWTVCRQVYFPRRLSITSDLTRRQYQIACQDLGKHLGHTATLADLSDDVLLGFTRYLADTRNLAPTTVNDRCGRIRTLWEWLARRKLVDSWPTVDRVREPERTPQAWTREQLGKLFDSVAEEDLDVGGVPGRLWWRGLLGVAWNTSERVSALMALRWSWLDGPHLHVPAEARKSRRKDMLYTLWPETVEVMAELREHTPDDQMFPFPYTVQTLYNRLNRILIRADLPHDRRHKMHCIRVSHATWCRAMTGHSAATLGHASETTTRRHYEDPRITSPPVRLFVPWD